MTSIKTFIQQDVLLPRLRAANVLVVYDPDRRYRELCRELESETRRVIDATESSIESREAAIDALQALGAPHTSLEGMLVYVPAKPPVTDEEKQRDPFAGYGAAGAVFPSSDGDDYMSLCLRARADYAADIRSLFGEDPHPSFAVIDAVGGGVGWPNLQVVLDVESARDILFALLVPSEARKAALKHNDAWVAEAKALFERTIGLHLKTRAKTWSAIADELWRYVLFSEFVFDLPGALPQALGYVPRATEHSRPLIDDLCERLRNDVRTQSAYRERAEGIEQELDLPAACREVEDLGERDTFPFEERSFFGQAAAALHTGDVDRLRRILAGRTRSVWVARAENQAQWHLLNTAAELIQACYDAERQLPEHASSQASLIAFYAGSLRDVDRLQRLFEQAAGDDFDPIGRTGDVTALARKAYRALADTEQALFIRHLEQSGWPPTGFLSNIDVFDRFVVPSLQESGHRVALLLIDALRYELGVELQKQLAGEGQAEVQPALAPLPTVTPVGMAGLLPSAGLLLRLTKKDGQAVPMLGEQAISTVSHRMDILRTQYGQRFTEMPLHTFLKPAAAVADTVDLLVLRSNEMDSDFESNPEAAPGQISRTTQRVRAAVRKAQSMGFREVFILTDHGFFLNPSPEAGSTCAKPPGSWITVHSRLLLGDGAADAANVVMPADRLGVRGDFAQVAFPRAMVAYQAGQVYFHGGASLQETVVPVLVVRLPTGSSQEGARPRVALKYRQGAKRITTRLPVVEISASSDDLFSAQEEVEILLEAQDRKGNVVGEAKPGGAVDPARGTVSVKLGESVQVALKMDMDFEGKFSIKALDPTTLTTFHTLDLETDYTV